MGLFGWLVGSPREKFAKEVLRTVRSAGISDAWYEAAEFRIGYRRTPDDEPAWIFLHNTWRECEHANRAERDERIAVLVRSVVLRSQELPQRWAEARPQLRPVLRPVTFAMGAPPSDAVLLARPFVPFLQEMVVIDAPDSMAYVTSATMAEWEVTVDEVFAAARSNLAAYARVGQADSDGPQVLRFVESGDAYFVSRLLVYGWLASLADRVGGRPVAFAPDVNTLVVIADNPDVMGAFLELMEKEYREAPRSISPVAYTIDEHREVVPYVAPPGHPLEQLVSRAEAILAASEYANQQQVLASRYEKEMVATFVASLMVIGRPDGSIFTSTTWSEDVTTILPRADYVSFVGDESGIFIVPWAAVAREVDLVPVEGMAPERFAVDGWPSPPVVDRLRASAVEP
jgi:hypothetical protein